MFTEARKMHFIEEVIKMTSEETLLEIESVIGKAKSKKSKKPSAKDLLGLWSKEDGPLIEKAIEEGCEQIHPDDWK